MRYLKANQILPEDMLEQIQQYIDGACLYIPRKPGSKREWGAGTATRGELAERNRAIYADYLSGASMQGLARKYFLSEKSIQRIIRQQRG